MISGYLIRDVLLLLQDLTSLLPLSSLLTSREIKESGENETKEILLCSVVLCVILLFAPGGVMESCPSVCWMERERELRRTRLANYLSFQYIIFPNYL